MLFLLTLETLLLVALLLLLNSPRQGTITHRHLLLLLGWVMGVAVLASSFGLFDGRRCEAMQPTTRPIWSWCADFRLRLGSACKPGASADRCEHRIRLASASHLGALFSLLGSMYLLFTAADHWWFFRTPEAGVGDLGGLDVPQVKCDMALIRLEEHRAVYCCAHGVVFNASHSAPFVPWPHDEAGTSRRLKEKFDEILQAAEEGDPRQE